MDWASQRLDTKVGVHVLKETLGNPLVVEFEPIQHHHFSYGSYCPAGNPIYR